ncbi:unnamed protein product, partial [Adineta steineri]
NCFKFFKRWFAIQAGLQCLKIGGRFIEIGKVDILSHSQLDMNLLLKCLSFLSVQLDISMQTSSKAISRIVDRIYQLNDTELAFRFLMSDQHKGKLILNMKSELPPVFPSTTIYNSQTCYILNGGTGAFALQLA